MVQIFKDTYEDLTPESFEKLLDDMAAGRKVKPGPQNGRQFSAPEGELTTLNEPGFYDNQRTYVRVEPPPPPPAAPPPSDAAKPKTAAPETAPAVKSPTEVKTGEAAAALAKTQEKAVSPPDRPTKAEEKPESGAPKAIEPAKLASWGEEKQPELLQAPRTGTSGDDLKVIWGVGPKLEAILHEMGVWHFDQIAAWGPAELRWVDTRLGNFKGRATRDDWIDQAKKLATGWRPAKSTGDKPTG
jgi:NADH-quinone oxidoreductase subunit E